MIIHSSWVEKRSVSLMHKYQKKYLILSWVHLCYFDSDESYADISSRDRNFEVLNKAAEGYIPVKSITGVHCINNIHGHILHIDVANCTHGYVHSRFYEFRCFSRAEVTHWMQVVLGTRDKYLRTLGIPRHRFQEPIDAGGQESRSNTNTNSNSSNSNKSKRGSFSTEKRGSGSEVNLVGVPPVLGAAVLAADVAGDRHAASTSVEDNATTKPSPKGFRSKVISPADDSAAALSNANAASSGGSGPAPGSGSPEVVPNDSQFFSSPSFFLNSLMNHVSSTVAAHALVQQYQVPAAGGAGSGAPATVGGSAPVSNALDDDGDAVDARGKSGRRGSVSGYYLRDSISSLVTHISGAGGDAGRPNSSSGGGAGSGGGLTGLLGGVLLGGAVGAETRDLQLQMNELLTEKQMEAIYKLEIVLLNVSAERTVATPEMSPSVAASPPARDTSIGRHVMNAFFHCLYSTNGNGRGGGRSMTQRDRNDVSRLFGQGLALWCAEATRPQQRSAAAGTPTSPLPPCFASFMMDHDSAENVKLLTLLGNILESVLVREFQKSCNFSGSGRGSAAASPIEPSSGAAAGDGAPASPAATSNSSNTLQAHNTPFRGDHPESLMITSYIKILAQLSGFLTDLLNPLVLTVLSDPDRFAGISASALPATVPANPITTSSSCNDSPGIKLDDSKMTKNRTSSPVQVPTKPLPPAPRTIGLYPNAGPLVTRSAAGKSDGVIVEETEAAADECSRDAVESAPAVTSESVVMEVEAEMPVETEDAGKKDHAHEQEACAESDASKDSTIAPANAKKESVVESVTSSADQRLLQQQLSIQQACALLFERIRLMNVDKEFPYCLQVLTQMVKKLTVGKNAELSSGTSPSVDPNNSSEALETSVAAGAERPEFGVYYSSLCSLFFLRLICPAILTPAEWDLGAVRGVPRPIAAGAKGTGGVVEAWRTVEGKDSPRVGASSATLPVSPTPHASSESSSGTKAESKPPMCGVGSSAILMIVIAHVLSNSLAAPSSAAPGVSAALHETGRRLSTTAATATTVMQMAYTTASKIHNKLTMSAEASSAPSMDETAVDGSADTEVATEGSGQGDMKVAALQVNSHSEGAAALPSEDADESAEVAVRSPQADSQGNKVSADADGWNKVQRDEAVAIEINEDYCYAPEPEQGNDCDHLLYDIWSGSNDDLPPVVSAINNIVKEIPFAKAAQLFEYYKRINSSSSLTVARGNGEGATNVTPVSAADEDAPANPATVRKALLEVAKHVQKMINTVTSGQSIPQMPQQHESEFNAEAVVILRTFCNKLGSQSSLA